ncbi:hypothetical protein VTO73DRAFT_1760 [Trametes versicolor]
MDVLPLETLQQIFELACTDGGITGCTLSLVSKGIRSAARTTRFHSISLVVTSQRLQSFVDLYKRECEPAQDDKPRIRHLHVAFPYIELDFDTYTDDANVLWPLETSRSPDPRQGPAPSSIPEHSNDAYVTVTFPNPSPNSPGITAGASRCRTAVMQQWAGHHRIRLDASADFRHDLSPSSPEYSSGSFASPHNPATHREYISAAQTLFRLVAPDLLILVIYAVPTAGGLRLPVIERPFHSLREATCVGVTDFRTLLIDSDDTKAAPLFPAMTRLHLVPPDRCGLSLSIWSAHAPHVSRLGVTRAESHVEEIERAVGAGLAKSLVPPLGTSWRGLRMPSSEELNSRWGPPSPWSQSPPESPLAPTYPSLRHLELELTPIEAVCEDTWQWYGEQFERLRQMVSRCGEVGIKAVEAEVPVEEQFHDYCERARLRWLERTGNDR